MAESTNKHPGNFLTRVFSGLDLFGKKMPKEDSWEKYSPFTQDEAREILTRDLPKQTDVRFTVQDKGYISFKIEADNIISEMRSCDFREHEAYKGVLEVAHYERGHGLGRALMRNQIEFYRACGIKKMEINAASEAGAYAWARMGFLPKDIEYDLKREVQHRWQMFEGLLTNEEISGFEKPGTIYSALDMRRREDLWQIADQRADMAPRIRDLFSRAANGDMAAAELADDLQSCYVDAKVVIGRWGLPKFDLQQEVLGGQYMPIGRLLLMRTEWEGYLDFNNEKQMARVESYVGGWKGIPVPARSALTAGG